ncbi:MAG: hypothetical protein GF330_03915 [Candidatus Eisenbacteria bacterium]|nr:hypothetical protein [Candidatus Eisenbacteria bacterium]
MFKRGKDKSDPAPAPAVSERATPRPRKETSTTLIGGGTVVSGVIRVNGSLRVDGEAEGQVFVSDTLTVGPGGVVKAEVQTGTAAVAGRVKGRIRAQGRVELQKGSRLEGDVHAATFKIEDGAFFQGNCVMGEDAAEPNAPPVAAERSSSDSLRVVGKS